MAGPGRSIKYLPNCRSLDEVELGITEFDGQLGAQTTTNLTPSEGFRGLKQVASCSTPVLSGKYNLVIGFGL